jgi:multiple antibiotic resistance protein
VSAAQNFFIPIKAYGVPMNIHLFINYYLKLFFILTPFFVLSVFISLTKDFDEKEKKQIAVKVSTAVIVSSFVIFFFGKYIFDLFGITLDAFRIGAGAILFLSAISMVQGKAKTETKDEGHDIAVVPLALPITVGPGVIGVLLLLGTEANSLKEQMFIAIALLCASLSVGIILYYSKIMENLVGKKGVVILSKITGLIVAAISAQIIFTGIKNFMG